jgi:hypothetical protein
MHMAKPHIVYSSPKTLFHINSLSKAIPSNPKANFDILWAYSRLRFQKTENGLFETFVGLFFANKI